MKKVSGKDTVKAAQLFSDAEGRYKQLHEKLQQTAQLQEYIPALDSIKSAVRFLKENLQFLSTAREHSRKVDDALSKLNELESGFQKAEEVKRFLKERRDQLKKELEDLGFTRELKQLNKNIFYYGEWLREYKSILSDQDRIERKALEILSKSSQFSAFMQKHSYLGQLFSLPGNYSSPQSLTGLQSRAQVQQLVQQQIGTASVNGVDPRQYVQQQMRHAQEQLNKLKDKVNELGDVGSDEEIPNFRINHRRSKSFLKNLELSVNFQNNRSNGILPVSSDVGIAAGFKPNNWFTGGVGFAGRINWGKDIRHIAVSYSGISARSFAEIKLKSKGSFYGVVGFEMNYRPEINDIEQLKDYAVWQKSGLAGISKSLSVKSKIFKRTKLFLLWDYLSYSQVPRTQPLIFRISYSIK